MAELVTAGAALVTLLLLAPWLALMPLTALAVVVIVYSFELIAPGEFLAIRRVRHAEFNWAVVAFLGVAFLGTLKGILVAVILSLLALVQQEVNPPVYAIGRKRGTDVFRPLSARHPHDETWHGLLLLRAEGRLFFANAHGVLTRMRAEVDRHRPKAVVGFWIDRAPVTNAQFRKFVKATGHVTLAERRADPAAYPNALPELLAPSSIVFVPPPGPIGTGDPYRLVAVAERGELAPPRRARQLDQEPQPPSRGACGP
ncbi:SUMF1/EgtB/PvdO family nonheme iron enzyme [Synechococcus sp. CS-1328]|uniref:SUMF1/EgtB/PvdO family nonheme iron enzyme n=1 Tax=Synechococcus sp. CS-1328 TaxID=2847976 RepID=UPI0037D99F56